MGPQIDICGGVTVKAGNSLCGCRFEVFHSQKAVTAILADGGSGAKGRLLSSLAVKMTQMLALNGETAAEIADMIVDSQPGGRKEGVDYAAFTVVQAFSDGSFTFEQLDMPELIVLKRGLPVVPTTKKRTMREKTINCGSGGPVDADTVIMINQGLVNAGSVGSLKEKWNQNTVAAYAANLFYPNIVAGKISQLLLAVGNSIAKSRPDNDMGAVVLRF